MSLSSFSDCFESEGSTSDTDTSRIDLDQNPRNPPFVIVIVHGIAGGLFGTWKTSEGLSLPRALLRQCGVDNPNVIAYQYDRKGVFGHTDIATSIRNVSFGLLEKIRAERQYAGDSISTPVVFFAHDLGGLIVKQALLIANDHDRYRSIALDTTRLIMFAVPQCSDLGHFSSLFRRSLLEILLMLPQEEECESVLDYVATSPTVLILERISKDFLAVARNYTLINGYREACGSVSYPTVSVCPFPILTLKLLPMDTS